MAQNASLIASDHTPEGGAAHQYRVRTARQHATKPTDSSPTRLFGEGVTEWRAGVQNRAALAPAGDESSVAERDEVVPPAATDSTGHTIQDVPQQVAISPDESRIAYVYSQPSCPTGAPCGIRQELLYSYSDRTTPAAAVGEQTNLTNPSWIDNNRVLAFSGHFRQVNIDSPDGYRCFARRSLVVA